MNKWITISINPPEVGTPIVLRTSDKYGYGCNYEVSNIDEKLFSQEEYETSLAATDYIEWMDLS
jgi:hypothetical protein